MLGKKHQTTNADWLRALDECTDIYSKEHIYLRQKEAIRKIASICPSYKKIAFGYSAGKDSLVIADIINKSGLTSTPLMWITPLQYPALTAWIDKNKPDGTKIITMNYGDYEYLESHPKMLFTQGTITQWMSLKWKEQKKYLIENGYDLFVTGRRIADQNNCGARADQYLKKGKYYDTFNIIADWTHEEVLAYIRYNGIELPPNYYWKNGFLIGSGAWAERDSYGATENEMWADIENIDASIVIEASKHLSSARRYLEYKKNGGTLK